MWARFDAYFKKANIIYEQLIQKSQANIVIINADKDISEIQKELHENLLSYFNRKITN